MHSTYVTCCIIKEKTFTCSINLYLSLLIFKLLDFPPPFPTQSRFNNSVLQLRHNPPEVRGGSDKMGSVALDSVTPQSSAQKTSYRYLSVKRSGMSGVLYSVSIPPSKWTCALKRDHFKRKFHLPTSNHQFSGEMSVFKGVISRDI